MEGFVELDLKKAKTTDKDLGKILKMNLKTLKALNIGRISGLDSWSNVFNYIFGDEKSNLGVLPLRELNISYNTIYKEDIKIFFTKAKLTNLVTLNISKT